MLRLIIYILLTLRIDLINANRLAPIDVLFHGSASTDIAEFEPRQYNYRDINERKVVFATPSIKLASCYLIKWDDSWIFQFISSKEDENDYEVTMVISDKKRFNELDKGGVVYLLPAYNFSYNESKGLGVYEWTSQKPVAPVAKIYFDSAMQAMKNFGVKVYFVNKKQFKKLLSLSGEELDNCLKKVDYQ